MLQAMQHILLLLLVLACTTSPSGVLAGEVTAQEVTGVAATPATPGEATVTAAAAADAFIPEDTETILQTSAADSIVAASVQQQWVSTNPGGGGAFNSPVITRPNGYWAVGSDLSGLYLSKDKGATWQIFGAANNLTATHIASLAAHPAGKLFVGTDSGIFTAGEDGIGMRKAFRDGYISAIAVSADPSVAYAARHPTYDALAPGILRTSNAGKSWQLVSPSNLPAGLRVVGLRTHPVDRNAVVVLSGRGRFASGPAQAWLSNDAGNTFMRLALQLGDNIMDIVYGTNPNNLNGMWLTMYRNRSTGRLYASQDAGGNWYRVADRRGVILVNALAWRHVRLLEVPIQHTDGSWEGVAALWESNDAGVSWSTFDPKASFIPGWSNAWKTWGFGSGFQGDVQTFGSDPGTPSTVLWSDSQFVYASNSSGRRWAAVVSRQVAGGGWRSRGIDNAVPAVVAPSPANKSLVYAGYYDMGLWRSDDGGGSWVSLNDARFSGGWQDAVGGNTLTVLPDPTRQGVVWAQLGGDLPAVRYLVKSINRGTTWTKLTAGLPASLKGLQGLSLDPASPSSARKLFVITNGAVYRSTDDGATWGPVLACPSCTITSVINGVVYAGGGGGLWRSASGASGTWAAVPGLSTAGWTADKTLLDWGYVGVMDITVAKDGRLWLAVLGQGFYQSSASAATAWTLVRSDVYARSVAADTAAGVVLTGSSSAYYAGGFDPKSVGVLVFNGQAWSKLNVGLAWPFATMVRVVGGVRWLLSPGQGVLRWQ